MLQFSQVPPSFRLTRQSLTLHAYFAGNRSLTDSADGRERAPSPRAWLRMVRLASRHRPLRLLCVEEDALQRKLLQACFEVLKAELLLAPRAAKAVWLFRRHPV